MENGGKIISDFFMYDLPYSKEEERLGMLCTTVGSVNVGPGVLYPQNKNEHPAQFRSIREGRVLSEFQFVYVTSGEGVLSLGSEVHKVKPGTVMLVLPGLRHSYCPLPESGWHEYWVGFRGKYFSGLVREGILSPDKVFFGTGVNDVMLSHFSHIFEEVRNGHPFYQMRACARIISLVAEVLSREILKCQPDHYETMVAKAKHLMEANVYGSINISYICNQLGVSSSSLNDVFKARTSMTPYQYYIQVKMEKAKAIIEEGNLTVKEVAYMMGFDDQYYFSRLFKNKTGLSPTRCRALSKRE